MKGDRINLRPFKPSDAKTLQRYANDPKVSRYLPLMPYPYSLDNARSWIKQSRQAARDNRSYAFAIEHVERNEIVGGVSLEEVRCQDRAAGIGYWLARPFWGEGLMTEAVRLVLEFSFSHLKLHRVYAQAHDKNVGSWKVMEKLGFVREGTLRKASRIGRRWCDVYTYGLLRPEFRRRPAGRPRRRT